MRIHGITPADIREAQKHFKDLSIDQMIKLKQLGIGAEDRVQVMVGHRVAGTARDNPLVEVLVWAV